VIFKKLFLFIGGNMGMGGNCCPSIPENPTKNKSFSPKKYQKIF